MEELLEWMRALNAEFWPPPPPPKHTYGPKNPYEGMPIVLQATRKLKPEELRRILYGIEEHQLMTSMFTKGMFGGFGMAIYAPIQFPGPRPQAVLWIIEDQLPGDMPKPSGSGRPDAWALFSTFTHSEKNRGWLEFHKMDPPRRRHDYDY